MKAVTTVSVAGPGKTRRDMECQMSWPLGLFVACPYCGRPPGTKCVPSKGRNPATPHWSRQKLAIDSGAAAVRESIRKSLDSDEPPPGCE